MDYPNNDKFMNENVFDFQMNQLIKSFQNSIAFSLNLISDQ